MTLPRSVDVVVVGSGITGAATAAAVAERGATVLVLDKEPGPAREGSGRAQGSLRLQGRHPAEFPLAVEALRLWREAADEDPGYDLELRYDGNLYFCTSPAEEHTLRELAGQARASGLRQVEFLDPGAVRDLVPAATGPFLGAMWSPADAQADPAKATNLFVRRAQHRGVTFGFDTLVTSITVRHGQVIGVDTSRGVVASAAVILSAGVWTSHLLAPLGLAVPIMPVALSELETRPLPRLFNPTVRAFGFGARQRPDGRTVISPGLGARVTRRASFYDVNGLRYWLPRARTFRKNIRLRVDTRQIGRELRHRRTLGPDLIPLPGAEPTPDAASTAAALSKLADVFPAARDARINRRWAGLIDMTPDGLPVIDTNLGAAGLTVIAGLCGHGLALGPVLGEIAAELALDHATTRPVEPFAHARYERGNVPAPEMMI